MGLLAPIFLVGLAAIAVPVVLHLFRREVAPQVPFTAVRFLQKRTIEQQERRRIQDPWLLLLRAAALALLALAFARPFLRAQTPAPPPVVIAVDVSYSMDAPGRMAAARAAAMQALDRIDADTPVALVTFADRATVVTEPTTDHGAVRVQIAATDATAGATRYAGALEAARGLMDGRPGRVVVVTDMQARGWLRGTTSLPDTVGLEVIGVGARVDNVLVREVTVARDRARVVVSNAGQSPATVPVSFGRPDDGSTTRAATQSVTLDGGVSRELAFEGPFAPGPYVARVAHDEGFAADNQRYAVLQDSGATSIRILIGDDVERARALFVERAFTALHATPDTTYAVRVMAGAPALAPEALRDADLVFWLSATGIDRRVVGSLEALVRDGGRLVVACGPGLDPRVADVVTRPFGITLAGDVTTRTMPPGVSVQDPRHPLFAALGEARAELARTTVSAACDMRTQGAAVPLSRFSDGSIAMAEVRVGAGHLIVFASDLGRQWNNLPVQAAFVPLIGELSRYMLGEGAGTQMTVAAVADPRHQRPGVWPAGPRGQDAAVNVDVSESDQAVITAEEFEQTLARTAADEVRVARIEAVRLEQEQRWWRYGLLLLVLALVAESVLARRPRSAVEVPS